MTYDMGTGADIPDAGRISTLPIIRGYLMEKKEMSAMISQSMFHETNFQTLISLPMR